MTTPPDAPDGDGDAPVGSSVAEETTRIGAVQHLQGASGHGVFSLLFAVFSGVLLLADRFEMAVLTAVVAYVIALNGVSIFLWDELRLYFRDTFDRGETSPTRTLRPHGVSAELKAELLAGAVLVGGITAVIGLLVAAVRTMGPRRAVVLAVVGLAVGDSGVLWRTYARSAA
jgi:hypothetical protein